MRSNEYYPGQEVRISASFSNLANVATDPSSVTIKVKSPSESVETFVYGTDSELAKDGTGLYHLNYTPDIHGVWFYRVESTGPATAAKEGTFVVKESAF
jgi:hypothetical protein